MRHRWGPFWMAAATIAASAWAGRGWALDNSAWRTFIRPVEFTDLLATDGEVWGATAEGGLLRWVPGADTFTVVRKEPGALASNRLTRVAIDGSGRLWTGSRASGAGRLDPGASRWQVVTAIDGLPSDSVTVLEPQGDSLWIGTARGVALWNGREIAGALPDGFTVSFDTTFVNPRITGVVVMGDTLWLATPRGVGHAHISALLSDWRPDNAGLASTDVADLSSDGVDLFARAGATVYRFRPDLGRWVVETAIAAARNLEDDNGVVLAPTDGGLFRWRPLASDTSWVRVADGLAVAPGREDPEPSLTPDGRLFAAAGDTLYEWTGAAWIAHPTPPGPVANDLLHLALSGSRLYVTSNGRGFSRYDGGAWRLWPGHFCGAGCDTDTTFVQAAFTFTVQIGYQGRIWVGCWSAPPSPSLFGPGGAVSSFLDFGDTQSFDHQFVVEDISQTDRMRHTWLLPGARDSTGRVWFGADTPAKGDVDPIGLTAYDPQGRFLGAIDEPILQSRFVHGLAVTAETNRLWIGYDGQGLDFLVLPASGQPLSGVTIEHIAETNNLPVRAVAAYGDSVWILTNTQLRMYSSTATRATPAARVIPVRGGQGVLGFQPLAIARDGTVWAGTLAGLRAYHPGGAQDSFTTRDSPLPDDEVRSLAIDPATGVVWLTTTGGLARLDPGYRPPAPPPLPALHLRLYPNPATLTGLGLGLRLTGEADAYRGEIYDVTGRLLRRFEAANGAAVWDGKDRDGHPVKPGLYFVRATAGGRQAVARLVVLH